MATELIKFAKTHISQTSQTFGSSGYPMTFQDFLLALIERSFNRATGLIYFGIGGFISAIEYLNADPKPINIFTNSPGNLVLYAGFVTVFVRTVQKWKHDYDARVAATKETRRLRESLSNAALANLPIMNEALKSALKKQMQTGSQRFHVFKPNKLLFELMKLHVVVTPQELGERPSSGAYVVHPNVWGKRDDILNDTSIKDMFGDKHFENRSI